MQLALAHKCLNIQFSMDLFLYMTFQLEMIIYVSFQICNLQILFLFFLLMKNLLPYPLCIVALDLQSLNE
jgi:hypothetical protein